MEDWEIKALEAMDRVLERVYADYLPRIVDGPTTASDLKHADGQAAVFDLGKGKNLYRYWEDAATKARYCYTPWADTRGYYWAFDYAPRGKGSRSGDPEKLIVVNGVRFRKRKAAKKRAEDRYNKATG